MNSIKKESYSEYKKNKKLHYELTKKFFRKNAADKKGYYNSKDAEAVKQEIQNRRMWEIYSSSLDRVLQNNRSIDSVIDVGCGMGNFTLELANRKNFKKIVGIDFLKDTFDIARENPKFFERVSFTEGNLIYMPFKDRSFDLAVCLNVLHHIHVDDFNLAIKELARITDKYLILEIRNKKNILDIWYSKIILPKYYRKLPLYTSSIQEINGLMKKFNFQLENMEGERFYSWTCRHLVIVYKRVK